MQLTGSQFTDTTALYGNDLSTFPDFPAEIRAPKGTVAGVSGFQVRFSSKEIFSPGDSCDVLVAMNAAALIKSGDHLKKGGILIANSAGFDKKNLKLAKCSENPLQNPDFIEGKQVKDKQSLTFGFEMTLFDIYKTNNINNDQTEISKK